MAKSSIELRRHLVQHLRRRGYLSDPQVAGAFLRVPRELFLPDDVVARGPEVVYRDEPIVIRRDAVSGAPRSSSSQPAIMALMLQMLALRPGHRVLEIGAGTGYNAALLDRLTRPGGAVVTVDVAEDVAREAAAGLRRAGSAAHVVVADGRAGLPGPGRFDRIEVTASTADVSRAWHEQLVPDGRLVLPLRLSSDPESMNAVTAFRRTAHGFESLMVTGGGFMPLRAPSGPPPLAAGACRASDGGRRTPGSASGSRPAIGAPFAIPREAVNRLRITVRYDDEPPRARWVARRPGHWIGVDEAPRFADSPSIWRSGHQ